MRKVLGLCLFFSRLYCSDSIYIIGLDSSSDPVYWSIVPPAPASSSQPLDMGVDPNGRTRAIAFSSNQIFYIVGDTEDDEFTRGVYWTIPNGGIASDLNNLTISTDSATVRINGIAFNSSGQGYIVGTDIDGNAAYWTISSMGVVSGATALPMGSYASSVGFTSAGNGYIAGADDMNNLCYWTVSSEGAVNGPFGLAGGETGGSASAYAVTAAPSGITYIGGADTSGVACYWTISSMGVASSSIQLDSGSNGQVRGIAFLSSGNGVFAGQSVSNNSSYWIFEEGSVGEVNNLPNGSGNGSAATGVAISSNGTVYIVGFNDTDQAVYWTLSTLSSGADYHVLNSGGSGVAFGIAIYFTTAPNAPSNLSARFLINDFGLVYEHAAVLNWTSSSSESVAGYNIYKNGLKIGTVNSSQTYYHNHDQNRSVSSEYGVSAFDGDGNESSQAVINLN